MMTYLWEQSPLKSMVLVLFFTVVFNIVIWLYLHMVSKCKLQVGMTRPTAPRFFVTANAANAFLKRSNVALILLIVFIVIVALIEFCTFDVSSRVSYPMKFISCESGRPVCKDVWIQRVWWEDSWYNSSAPLSSQCEVRNHIFDYVRRYLWLFDVIIIAAVSLASLRFFELGTLVVFLSFAGPVLLFGIMIAIVGVIVFVPIMVDCLGFFSFDFKESLSGTRSPCVLSLRP